ncbi:hypothetical protein [Bacillus cereus]|uniref:hypothetical protein n=1 Tax=Bacillus cereus TaxID=1396 RepID=UPI0007ABD507|nr:hypothetical protein [Bacillus cereus]KZD51624.1 hypothetical protein B4084_0913 [Bacillus cereus]MDG1570378.1 hypothetical protein [Bacillus cereus]MDZ4422638.1 hypothetical protein [Bacillus cereus]PEX21377.1 hypothetical protein CN458_28320 [Bacillus cereus]PFT87816.1 hypothetical protein COK66_27785 [Bacillus cereus]
MNTDKLINKILLSSDKDLISFIDQNFLCKNFDDFSDIKKKEESLFKLEEDVLNHALFRLESLEEIYDTSKGSSAGFNLVGIVFGFMLKDYISIFVDPSIYSKSYFLGQIIVFSLVSYGLIRILKSLNSHSENKSKIIYFKRLLNYVLKEKDKEKRKGVEAKAHAI